MKTYQNPKTQVVIIASSMITLQSISNNGGIKGIKEGELKYLL